MRNVKKEEILAALQLGHPMEKTKGRWGVIAWLAWVTQAVVAPAETYAATEAQGDLLVKALVARLSAAAGVRDDGLGFCLEAEAKRVERDNSGGEWAVYEWWAGITARVWHDETYGRPTPEMAKALATIWGRQEELFGARFGYCFDSGTYGPLGHLNGTYSEQRRMAEELLRGIEPVAEAPEGPVPMNA